MKTDFSTFLKPNKKHLPRHLCRG